MEPLAVPFDWKRVARGASTKGIVRPADASRTDYALAVVDRLLERVEQRQRLHVGEGQDLGGIDAAYALALVDPVVGVGESRPGEAAGRAAGRRLLVVDHEGQAPALVHAGEELGIVGERWRRGLEHADARAAHGVLRHGR